MSPKSGTRPAAGSLPLPPLRDELELLPGANDAHDLPTWLIHDPMMNRFIQIEPSAREALRHWSTCATVGELVAKVASAGRVHVDANAVVALVEFLHTHQLTVSPKSDGWRSFSTAAECRRSSFSGWLVHNYLFFRLPLVRPQEFLEKTIAAVRILWSPPAITLLVVIALVGIYLASRQWDLFVTTLVGYLSVDGILTAIVTLVFVKLVHELGHAYAAVAFGCRVHTMGIAVVIMAPMPYTDVTDAWRLTERWKRHVIDAAGMMAEAAVAAVALLAWTFLPDGPLRSAAFVLSAVSIISSLAINLNPFMRFDGYYLLSEMTGIDNLQTRSFEVGRWKLREILFGLGAPCPEDLPSGRIVFLYVYAWATWIYRLILFVGIALLVYHYFFKVLGIILFVIEIVYFIARPIGRELAQWWKMKSKILATTRTRLTLGALAAALVAVLIPWSSRVEIPAVLEAAELQAIHPKRNAQITSVQVRHGDIVAAGQTIATLRSSDIEEELNRARISLRLVELRFARRLADAIDREGSLVLESSITALRTKIAGLENEQAELTLKAPFDGRIVDLNVDVQPGRWVSPRDMVAIVAGGMGLVAKGYVAEADVGRIEPGAAAWFIPEHPVRERVDLRVERIATAGATQIEIAELASVHSGPIHVSVDDRRRLLPATAHYQVTLTMAQSRASTELAVRGLVIAEGRAESVLARVWRRTLSVLVRESGA